MSIRLIVTVVLLLGSSWTIAAGMIRVGMSADYPPLHYKQDGRIVGIEADNATAVSKITGLKVKIVELPFKQLIPSLLAGDIDAIMSGMSVTAERSEQVAFTDSYLRVGQMAIMHRDKVTRFAQPWAVYRDGIRIGVEPGTTGAAFAKRELTDAKVSFYEDADAAFEGLRTDQIDLYVHDAPTSWQLANGSENSDLLSLYTPLTEEMLAWAVRKDDQLMLDELNQAMAMMKSNGTLQYILNRWIPVQVEVR